MGRIHARGTAGLGVAALLFTVLLTNVVWPSGAADKAEKPSKERAAAAKRDSSSDQAGNSKNPKSPAAKKTSVSVRKGTASATRASNPKPVKDSKWTVRRPVVPAGEKPEPADNSYCLVCHANYQEEKLTTGHQQVGVGCETCHGISMEHSADENNTTPPDIMWVSFRVNSRCMTCHPKEGLLQGSDAESHQQFFDRLDHPEQADTGETDCVGCHARAHKLAHRTRIWDRETGKLLKQSGGPAMDR